MIWVMNCKSSYKKTMKLLSTNVEIGNWLWVCNLRLLLSQHNPFVEQTFHSRPRQRKFSPLGYKLAETLKIRRSLRTNGEYDFQQTLEVLFDFCYVLHEKEIRRPKGVSNVIRKILPKIEMTCDFLFSIIWKQTSIARFSSRLVNVITVAL